MFSLLRSFKIIKVFPIMKSIRFKFIFDRFSYFFFNIISNKWKIRKKWTFNLCFCGGYNNYNGFINYCLSYNKFYNEQTYILFDNVNKHNSEINYEEFNYGIIIFKNFYQTILTIFIISIGKIWSKLCFLW